MIYQKLHRNIGWILLPVVVLFLVSSCSEELVNPPVITVVVNGEEITSDQDTVFLANGSLVEYNYKVLAFATIQEIYLVKYSGKLIKNPENPAENILTEPEGELIYPVGLTRGLEEEVKGTLVYAVPALEKYGLLSVMLVVSDVEGNEVRRSFQVANE